MRLMWGYSSFSSATMVWHNWSKVLLLPKRKVSTRSYIIKFSMVLYNHFIKFSVSVIFLWPKKQQTLFSLSISYSIYKKMRSFLLQEKLRTKNAVTLFQKVATHFFNHNTKHSLRVWRNKVYAFYKLAYPLMINVFICVFLIKKL